MEVFDQKKVKSTYSKAGKYIMNLTVRTYALEVQIEHIRRCEWFSVSFLDI